jgi:hypothetical protein
MGGEVVKALSGRQPWWWAILHAGKRIENRRMVVRGVVRPPTWHRYREPILLHAAKGCTSLEYADAFLWMKRAGFALEMPPIADMPRGGIVGRARIIDVLPPHNGQTCNHLLEHFDSGVDHRWHMPEQYGFVLTDVEPLPFRPWPGSLGLFEVPEIEGRS